MRRYNSQASLRDKLNETRDLNGASMLYFAEPDKLIRHGYGDSTPTTQTQVDQCGNSSFAATHNRHHNRSDTLETVGSPNSSRPLTRMFEHLNAEDTLVERSPYGNGMPRAALTPSE